MGKKIFSPVQADNSITSTPKCPESLISPKSVEMVNSKKIRPSDKKLKIPISIEKPKNQPSILNFFQSPSSLEKTKNQPSILNFFQRNVSASSPNNRSPLREINQLDGSPKLKKPTTSVEKLPKSPSKMGIRSLKSP